MQKSILRVSPLPREGAEKLHQRFSLTEVPVHLRVELEEMILFRHMDVVEGQQIVERAERFGDWLGRAMKEAFLFADEATREVLMDFPPEAGFLLPAFQKVVEEKGFRPVYVSDREDPWKMVIFPTGR